MEDVGDVLALGKWGIHEHAIVAILAVGTRHTGRQEIAARDLEARRLEDGAQPQIDLDTIEMDTRYTSADRLCQVPRARARLQHAHARLDLRQLDHALRQRWRMHTRSGVLFRKERRLKSNSGVVPEAMGFGDHSRDLLTMAQPPCKCWKQPDSPVAKPDIIAISEGGMGFRDTSECWQPLPFMDAKIIVFKTAGPLLAGDLWKELSDKYWEKLLVVVSADELRKSSARISSGLSWEATFGDLGRELSAGGRFAGLAKCRHLVVTCGCEGAAWFTFNATAGTRTELADQQQVRFVFQAGKIEHDHAQETEGTAFGFLTCMTAALARTAALGLSRVEDPASQPFNFAEVDFGGAIEGGLAAMRDLREKGHGPATEKPDGYPIARLSEAVCNPGIRYTQAGMSLAHAEKTFAMPGASFHAFAQHKGSVKSDFGRLIAIHGPIALENHFKLPRFPQLAKLRRPRFKDCLVQAGRSRYKLAMPARNKTQAQGPSAKDRRIRIFFSCGHVNNEELVRRIYADLKKRGHDVWFDQNEIKFNDEWRRAIIDGILQSNRVLSFLSKHSTRDPRVCLGEIAIAIGAKGGNIQTILFESEREVKPPPSISHIQWLDMHDWKERRDAGESAWEPWYQAKLAEIVAVVESDESRRFAGEIKTLEELLKPTVSDFAADARIRQLLEKKLVGRTWLFEAVENSQTTAEQPSFHNKN